MTPTRSISSIRLRLATLTAAMFIVPLAGDASAQAARRIAVEFAPGNLSFADDGVVNEGMLAGSLRFYVTPRLSVGPEISYIQGNNHSHLMLTGNVTFDFLGPRNGRPPLVTPFVVAGTGLFWTREQFRLEPYTSSDPSFTAGGGVKGHVGQHLVVGGEVRIGWELHIRANGIVGVRF